MRIHVGLVILLDRCSCYLGAGFRTFCRFWCFLGLCIFDLCRACVGHIFAGNFGILIWIFLLLCVHFLGIRKKFDRNFHNEVELLPCFRLILLQLLRCGMLWLMWSIYGYIQGLFFSCFLLYCHLIKLFLLYLFPIIITIITIIVINLVFHIRRIRIKILWELI